MQLRIPRPKFFSPRNRWFWKTKWSVAMKEFSAIFFNTITKFVIERFDWTFVKVWVIPMTSSIFILMKVFQNCFCRFFLKLIIQSLFFINILIDNIKIDPKVPVSFTELYRKIRKLPGSQNFRCQFFHRVLIGI